MLSSTLDEYGSVAVLTSLYWYYSTTNKWYHLPFLSIFYMYLRYYNSTYFHPTLSTNSDIMMKQYTKLQESKSFIKDVNCTSCSVKLLYLYKYHGFLVVRITGKMSRLEQLIGPNTNELIVLLDKYFFLMMLIDKWIQTEKEFIVTHHWDNKLSDHEQVSLTFGALRDYVLTIRKTLICSIWPWKQALKIEPRMTKKVPSHNFHHNLHQDQKYLVVRQTLIELRVVKSNQRT
jgi:hypothetical protein